MTGKKIPYGKWQRKTFSILICCLVLITVTVFEPAGCEEPPQTRISTHQASYAPLEDIIIRFKGFPGTKWDWITIVEPTAPPSAHGDFIYTGARQSGSLRFPGLPEGTYEARAFHNRPDGVYRLRAGSEVLVKKIPGHVKKKQDYLAWTKKDVYLNGESIGVEFNDLPGNKQDWIAVAPVQYPPEKNLQRYFLAGKKKGTATFKGLGPGQYEVRVYFNWPEDAFRIRDRYGFRVEKHVAGSEEGGPESASSMPWPLGIGTSGFPKTGSGNPE